MSVNGAARFSVGLLCMGLSASAGAAEYRLDTHKSLLVVKTFKEGAAARLAHNHVVHAPDFSGSVQFDAQNPGNDSIRVEVHTATLTVDDFARRKQFGETGLPSDDELADITKNLRSEDQLYVERYPTMGFVSNKVEKTAEGAYKVTGKLTIRGVTKEVSFPAQVTMEGTNFRSKAELKFKQSNFGYKPYSAMFGAVRVADEAILFLDIVAVPAK
jgi:polyisoprenoid-binding protein YceI